MDLLTGGGFLYRLCERQPPRSYPPYVTRKRVVFGIIGAGTREIERLLRYFGLCGD